MDGPSHYAAAGEGLQRVLGSTASNPVYGQEESHIRSRPRMHNKYPRPLRGQIGVGAAVSKVILSGAGSKLRLNGSTRLKNRILAHHGWTVLRVPFFQWQLLLTRPERMEYLKRMLDGTLFRGKASQ